MEDGLEEAAPGPRALTDGQPVAEVVDAVAHDDHPGDVGDARVLEVGARVAGPVRVVPLVAVPAQRRLVPAVVVGGGGMGRELGGHVEAVAVSVVHDLLLLRTQVVLGGGLLVPFQVRQLRLVQAIFRHHRVVGSCVHNGGTRFTHRRMNARLLTDTRQPRTAMSVFRVSVS